MMTVHVLHAGDGYTYLTRQVASHDQTRQRGEELTDYYQMEGNPPGIWGGRGAAVLGMSGEVTEAQMKALFGEGLRPDADEFVRARISEGMSAEDAIKAARLGRRFMVPEQVDDGWAKQIGAAYKQFRVQNGRAPEPGPERDLIRWTEAAKRMTAALKRTPKDAEVSAFLAQQGKQQRLPVAGYDLVFTPVKSVSALWGLADRETAEVVRKAHEDAWREAIAWVEDEAALTRVGAAGIAQVNTNGLTWEGFEHRSSRSGDPNLHTHVAVSTKVQGEDGKWRSLDGRVLHQLGVAASERYNTNIEKNLRDRLGARFAAETRGRNKRPVRELVGVPKELRDLFSKRRASIEAAYAELAADYVSTHGHTPPRAAQMSMAQQATLKTREAKDDLKSEAEERSGWWAGVTAAGLTPMAESVVTNVRAGLELTDDERKLAAKTIGELATIALDRVEKSRSTWKEAHVVAEAERVAREYADVRADVDVRAVQSSIATLALANSIGLTPPEINAVPQEMRRQDGESIYMVHGTDLYTSERILRIEDRLLTAAQTTAGFQVPAAVFEATLAQMNAAAIASGKHVLDDGQEALARAFATGGTRLGVGIGPAGTGKTTSMRVFARAVESAGGRVLALAPTAVASTVLAEEIDVEADTAHMLVQMHRVHSPETLPAQYRIDENTILLIDEAGMAGTPLLGDVLALAERLGASIRLLGDPAQLAAVEAGGALRLIERTAGAAYLTQVHRFEREDEAAATLKLRDGRRSALGFYVTNDRVRGGLRASMLEEIYAAWEADNVDGKESIMVAGTNDEVSALNARARLDRIARGDVAAGGVALHNGNTAGVGDTIVTRNNDRRLRANRGRDYVANGDLWTVIECDTTGMKVRSHRHHGVVTLPADYVSAHVELGYSATINRVQGMTVDTSHILIDPESNAREQLYVAATRGRSSNRLYTVVDTLLGADGHKPDQEKTSIIDALTRVLNREAAELSAHETLQKLQDHAESLARLVPEYEDAQTRLVAPGTAFRMESVIRNTLPFDLADQILEDDAWVTLSQRMAAHEARGQDVPAMLRTALAANAMDSYNQPRSLAKVLHHRLGAADETSAALPGWITPAPAETGENAEVRSWAIAHANLIADRIGDLTMTTIDTHPYWLDRLTPQPDDPRERAVWTGMVARIVAYRDYAGVADPETITGPPPAHDDPAYRDAAVAARHLRATSDESTVDAKRAPENTADRLQEVTAEAPEGPRALELEPQERRHRGPTL